MLSLLYVFYFSHAFFFLRNVLQELISSSSTVLIWGGWLYQFYHLIIYSCQLFMAIPPPHLFWGPGNFLFLLHVTNLLSFFFFFLHAEVPGPEIEPAPQQ